MSMNSKRVLISSVFLFCASLHFSFAQEAGDMHLPQVTSSGARMVSLPLDASMFTGESFTSLPIELPLSSGNIQKKLSLGLQYRSGGGNSWVGKGWNLDSGYVAKINKYGANSPQNPYILSLNGGAQELVNVGGIRYSTKSETFRRIEFNGTTWQVWDRDGTQYLFEIFAAGKWVLTKVTDIHGVFAVIEYNRLSSEEIYLKEIRYPGGLR